MAQQLCYENIEAGDHIPGLVKRPTSRQLVRFACLTQKFYEVHYDKDFAIRQGLPGVIVQGELVSSFLMQMLTDWIGNRGYIKKYSFSFRRPIPVNEDVTCKGNVSTKYMKGEERCLECDIWAENTKGENTITGKAVLVLHT
jgi:acyl dehydratase